MISFASWEQTLELEGPMGVVTNPRCDVCLSMTDANEKLLGGVIYTNYLGASIQIHITAIKPGFLTRTFLWFAFTYPFEQLKVTTLFGQVQSDNKVALDLDRRLGFKEVLRIDGIYPTGQLVLLSMTRDECRWLTPPPGVLRGEPDGQSKGS